MFSSHNKLWSVWSIARNRFCSFWFLSVPVTACVQSDVSVRVYVSEKVPDRRAAKHSWNIKQPFTVLSRLTRLCLSIYSSVLLLIPERKHHLYAAVFPSAALCVCACVQWWGWGLDCDRRISGFYIATLCWQDLSAVLVMVCNKDNWSPLTTGGKRVASGLERKGIIWWSVWWRWVFVFSFLSDTEKAQLSERSAWEHSDHRGREWEGHLHTRTRTLSHSYTYIRTHTLELVSSWMLLECTWLAVCQLG